jgi:hypothetical protein
MEAWGASYSPPRESIRWGVRDPDMSRLEAGHVWQPSLESGLGTGTCPGSQPYLRLRPRNRTCPKNLSRTQISPAGT